MPVGRFLLALLCLGPLAAAAEVWPQPPEAFVFALGFGRPGEAPFLADLDGDGFDELLMFAPGGEGTLYACANEAGQKAHASQRIFTGLYGSRRPVAVGDLDGDGRAAFCGVDAQGRLRVARRSAAGTYVAETLLQKLPAAAEALLAGDADGDGLDDLALITSSSAVWLVRSLAGSAAPEVREVGRDVPPSALLADMSGDGRADLVWGAGDEVVAQPLAGGARVVVASGLAGREVVAVGDLDGDGAADIVTPGAILLLREGGLVSVADPRLACLSKRQSATRLGDVDGDGLLDIVWFQLAGAHAVRVMLNRPPRFYAGTTVGLRDRDGDTLSDLEELLIGTDPGHRDTDRDGLLDGWEVRGFRGVPLPRLGASPLHRDLFLEIDVERGADMKRVRKAVKHMEAMFGGAPVDNPDGERGIRLHCAVDTIVPIWKEKHPNRHQMRELFFTPTRAGIYHWMHVAHKGGGGQSNLLSDHGSCAGGIEATLPHELGHQIGLHHGGASGMNGIPIYPSLMNYAYNYQLGGKWSRIDYSAGHLAQLSLDENALSERVEVDAGHLEFLRGPPFRFRAEARGEGATWIDWNRDGEEDAEPVRANINTAAGAGYGPRPVLDKAFPRKGATTTSLRAPLLLSVGAGEDEPGRLALYFVDKTNDRLAVRVLDGDRLSALSPVRGVSDEPELDQLTAYAEGEQVHLFAQQGERVLELSGELDGPLATVATITSGVRAAPAACLRVRDEGTTAYLALRHEATGAVTLRRRSSSSAWSDPLLVPELSSMTPVSLAHDTVRDELLVAFTQKQSKRAWRLRLARLDPETLSVRSLEWVGGPKGRDATSRRPAMVFEVAPWLPSEGRVDIFHAAVVDGPRPKRNMFRSYTIGDKAWRGRRGWKEDMTWNEWSYTRDAPSAAWYRGRPFQVTRFYSHYSGGKRWNDHLAVGPRADGVCDADLRDHDDWELITSYGLERSILQVRTPKGRR